MYQPVYAVVVILIGICANAPLLAQSGQRNDAVSKLNKAKKEYEGAREKAVTNWEKEIDKMFKAPKNMTANQAIQLNSKLKELRTIGSRYDDVPTDNLVLGPASRYFASIAKARWNLYLGYERMNRQLQHGKFEEVDQQKIQDESLEFMKETERLDKVKPGNDFRGTRHDPGLNVNVPIHLKITERNGHQFTGRIDFNNGKAIFNVAGTVAGLEVAMQKVGVMVKGGDRYFEYYGYIVGNRLLLNHRGKTVDKKLTAGWSWMAKK